MRVGHSCQDWLDPLQHNAALWEGRLIYTRAPARRRPVRSQEGVMDGMIR